MMLFTASFFLLLVILKLDFSRSQTHSSQGNSTRTGLPRLSKPLIGNDGRVYACSGRNLFAFEGNGNVAWTLLLPYLCNPAMAPVHGGKGKIYLVAENRILKIDFQDVTIPPVMEVFFGPEKGQLGASEVVGFAVIPFSSSVFINIKNRGLFAYMRGQLIWSGGPVLTQFGYRLGCSKSVTGCFFDSAPVVDQCEASIYISNTMGEVYSLSTRSPHFNWVRDLSTFDKVFTLTAGNNGLLYVTIPSQTLILAIQTTTASILWQRYIGPLSSVDSVPVIDSNGWISIGSLDGFLYSISPSGDLTKIAKASEQDHVVQVTPVLDCSGYGVYISQTKMEGKASHISGGHAHVSAMRPIGAVFTLLVPATGAVYWSGSYPGEFASALSQSNLQHFVLDEGALLAFVTASSTGNPLTCRSRQEKIVSTCSLTRPKYQYLYTGSERKIVLFLFFETVLLLVLAGVVRFCCIFWRKKKLQDQDLGVFLEKRRLLQSKKKEVDRTITELEQKSTVQVATDDIAEELGSLVQQREVIHRKLSTTYSLGRDRSTRSSYLRRSKSSLLPLHDHDPNSHWFQSFRTFSAPDDPAETSSSAGNESKVNIAETDSSTDEVQSSTL